MAPPDRVFRSPSQSVSQQPIGLLDLFGGPEAAAARQTPTNRGILGFMVPPEGDRGYRHTPFVPNVRASRPSHASSSIDNMTRAELENLTPYERWLVTLPDDSPKLTSFSDSRVGPAPVDPPRHLVGEATIDPGSVILTASDGTQGLPPIPPRKPVVPPDQRHSYAQDVDTLARTINGEANTQPRDAQIGVAWVARNRLREGYPGKAYTSIHEVASDPTQFQTWMTDAKHKKNFDRIKAPNYGDRRFVRQVLDVHDVLQDRVPDPTGGAVQFFTAKYDASGKIINWPKTWDRKFEATAKIGDTVFMRRRRDPPRLSRLSRSV